MNRAAVTLVALFASALAAAGALDLTPTPHDFTAHGIAYRQLKFKDDKRTVVMDLPNRWTFRGNATRLQLTPPDQKFAEGTIEVIRTEQPAPPAPQPQPAPPPAPQPFDDAGKQELERQVLAALPPGSQAATVSGRHESVVLGGKPGYEVVVAYQTLGEKFRRSTVFVNFPDMRLVFRVTAKESDFEQVANSFQRSALSLTWE